MTAGDVGRSQPPELRIALLGGFHVQADGRDVLEREWKRRSAAAIVKILALTPGHRLHREQLMEMLWPDSDPEQASNNLYQALYAARRALGSDPGRYLVLHDQIIQFAPDVGLSVDSLEFVNAVNEARRIHTSDALRTALRLFTGELLPDDRYASWIADSREALESLYAEAALELAGLEDGTDN
jgi:DNA-binding SARP family transcriptional activator